MSRKTVFTCRECGAHIKNKNHQWHEEIGFVNTSKKDRLHVRRTGRTFCKECLIAEFRPASEQGRLV